ncbi:hypothetical protein OEZ85_001426 [Tetradesmus obliquus]|uniref:SGNH hydrolase-type esterase domain-containing protein n=1 Tax=Tetradesmus obliquus TaxID=3088 RepID=A0ABY8UNG0_TETOB|nr:hypothetical protein OEZ85_001426 [Tetradesmus obliquus]
MMAAKLYGPEEVLKLAAKPSPAPRNSKTLAQRLCSPGEIIKVVAFGGSVTAGYGLDDRRQNWAQQLTNWLAAAFPEVQLRLSNLARDGTTITMAESCWYQYTPEDADLILIDFNLNSCSYSTCRSVVAPQIAAYENLIRRLISQAPNAALLSFEAFAFGSYSVSVAGGGTATMPMPYYNSGEDMHAMVAARYGVPLVENSTEVQKSGITSVQVTAHPECVLQVTAVGGGGWVQLLGVAVVPFFSNVALTSVDSTAMEMGL